MTEVLVLDPLPERQVDRLHGSGHIQAVSCEACHFESWYPTQTRRPDLATWVRCGVCGFEFGIRPADPGAAVLLRAPSARSPSPDTSPTSPTRCHLTLVPRKTD